MQMGVGAANEPNDLKKKQKEKKEARIIHRTRLLTDGSIKKGTADHSRNMESKHFWTHLSCSSAYPGIKSCNQKNTIPTPPGIKS